MGGTRIMNNSSPETEAMTLETRDLHVDFGGVHAVDGLNFQIAKREIHAVIGPNGAGKTTFFNALSGVVQPTRGRIFFRGREITGVAPRIIARLGLVRTFQITSIFPGLSVSDNLWVAAQSHYGISAPLWSRNVRSAIAAKIDEIIELLKLSPIARSIVSDLSYGDQRVVEVALALALEPKLLLLDEPTAGMSPHETDRIARLVKRMGEIVSIVIIEHDMEVVTGIADTVSVLNFGQLIAEGPPTAIKNDPQVQKIYLGSGSC